MPLCARCHQHEATVHFTTVMNGTVEETVGFCKDCAPATGFDLNKLSLQELEALSVTGKRCEFCGQDAFSGQMGGKDGGTYWCFDCGQEFAQILSSLCVSERPELLQRGKKENLFLSFCFDPEFKAWSEAASLKAVQMLREKRRGDGRDPGGKA